MNIYIENWSCIFHFLFYLENQPIEAESYTNHPDENTCANSNQIQTTDDLNNSHTEDIDIYDAREIYESGKDCVLSLCACMLL